MLPDVHHHGNGGQLPPATSFPSPFSGTVTNAKPKGNHDEEDGNESHESDGDEGDDDEDDEYDDGGEELLEHYDVDARTAEVDRPDRPDGQKHDSLDYTDNFESASIDQIATFGGGQDGTPLPVFLVEPKSAYVMKNRPAELYCKASHALQVTFGLVPFQISFKCSGSTKPPPTVKEHHTDPHSGIQLQEATATITRELVDEFFGDGPFKCECRAYSSRGHVKTQPVTIQVATIKKQISISPRNVRVGTGGRAELNCIANATPAAKVVWLKNNIPVQPNPPFVLVGDNSLLIARVELQDMANYTCVAENIAGKRISEPVSITVYVDGGWSPWGLWTDCKCPGHPKQGQKRTRACNSPAPINNGAQCPGASTETTPDCLPCSAGRWSAWSEWSECGPDCTRTRQRSCIGGRTGAAASTQLMASQSGGAHTVTSAALVANGSSSTGPDRAQAFVVDSPTIGSCVGKSQQTEKCNGGMCNYTVQE
ncbi:netrin receptor unc-5-like [Anopheles ziemanni]|uniref:netrin receptor unc-5-like n=1 Tax=Anopheles coustani TaxID=139045 RepID=UPI002658E8CF|nr:netrin receptor unc-5-like [Anopheles coustani]XP_058177196.1 netrin receptor unc-5-like [Anopheles ziemanni]